MVEHRSVVNLLCAMRNALGIEATDRLLALTTVSFDIAALEMYLPLITGAELIPGPSEREASTVEVQSLIARYAVTMSQATPSRWRLLLERWLEW